MSSSVLLHREQPIIRVLLANKDDLKLPYNMNYYQLLRYSEQGKQIFFEM